MNIRSTLLTVAALSLAAFTLTPTAAPAQTDREIIASQIPDPGDGSPRVTFLPLRSADFSTSALSISPEKVTNEINVLLPMIAAAFSALIVLVAVGRRDLAILRDHNTSLSDKVHAIALNSPPPGTTESLVAQALKLVAALSPGPTIVTPEAASQLAATIKPATIGDDPDRKMTPLAASVPVALLALLLFCTGCVSGKSPRFNVTGGITYDGVTASASRRASDGKTTVGVEVDANELQRDLQQ